MLSRKRQRNLPNGICTRISILESDQTDEQTGEDRYYIFQACKNLENFRRKTNSGPALPPPSLKIPIKRAKTARHKSRMTTRHRDPEYSGIFQIRPKTYKDRPV